MNSELQQLELKKNKKKRPESNVAKTAHVKRHLAVALHEVGKPCNAHCKPTAIMTCNHLIFFYIHDPRYLHYYMERQVFSVFHIQWI